MAWATGQGDRHGTSGRHLGGLLHTPPRIDRRTEASLTCWLREPSRPRGRACPGFRGPAVRTPRRAAGPHPGPAACWLTWIVPVESPPFDLSGHHRPTVASCDREASLGTGEHPSGASLHCPPAGQGRERGLHRWGRHHAQTLRRRSELGRPGEPMSEPWRGGGWRALCPGADCV